MAAARTLCCCRLVRSVRCNAIHVTGEGKRKAAIAFQFCSGYAAAMAKPRKTYVCQACGSVSNRWQGQCPDCAEWNTLVEQAAPTAFSARHDLQTGGQRIQSSCRRASRPALPNSTARWAAGWSRDRRR
jgi:hypothetical protein